MPDGPPSVVALLRETLLRREKGSVYGVVDGARCVDLAYEAKILLGVEIRSLFLPEQRELLWNVAPYVVPVDPAGPYLENWGRRWGTSAGILLVSDAGPEDLWGHLRGVFVSQDESGQEYFFRFYDPRVLRPFLPTCSASQLEEFFGPVREIVVEAEGGGSILVFGRENGRLVERKVSLVQAPGKDAPPDGAGGVAR